MTLYEVHNALASALGDPFAESGSSLIKDGVRFSKTLRQKYLYRAAMSVLNEFIKQVVPLPQSQAAPVLARLFPSLITLVLNDISDTGTFALNVYDSGTNPNNYRIAFVLSLMGRTSLDNPYEGRSIPIISSYDFNKITSKASHMQANDPIACIDTVYPISGSPEQNFYIRFNTGGTDFSGGFLETTFIRYPLNQDLSDGTVKFDFEDSFMNVILAKAALYGQSDGGDTNPSQIYPLLTQ